MPCANSFAIRWGKAQISITSIISWITPEIPEQIHAPERKAHLGKTTTPGVEGFVQTTKTRTATRATRLTLISGPLAKVPAACSSHSAAQAYKALHIYLQFHFWPKKYQLKKEVIVIQEMNSSRPRNHFSRKITQKTHKQSACIFFVTWRKPGVVFLKLAAFQPVRNFPKRRACCKSSFCPLLYKNTQSYTCITN